MSFIYIPAETATSGGVTKAHVAAVTLRVNQAEADISALEAVNRLQPYDPLVTYATDDHATYNDILYCSLSDGNTGNRPDLFVANWSPVVVGSVSLAGQVSDYPTANSIARRGPDGEGDFTSVQLRTGAVVGKYLLCNESDGVAAWSDLPNRLQTYAGATTYAEGDHVTYEDVLYKSLADDNTGNQPDLSSDITESLFTLAAPVPDTVGSGPQSIGNHFLVNSDSSLTAIRHCHQSGNLGANLYVWQVAVGFGSATLLRTIANPLVGDALPQWADVAVSPPIALTAGTVYTVSKDSNGLWAQEQPPNYPEATTLFTPQLINGTTSSYADIGANWPGGPTVDTNYYISPVVSVSGGSAMWEAVVGADSATVATTVASHTTTLAAATSSATAETLAKRDASGDCYFNNVIVTGVLFAGGDSEFGDTITWSSPIAGSNDFFRLVRKSGVVYFSLDHSSHGYTTGSGSSGLTTVDPSIPADLRPLIPVQVPIMVYVNGTNVLGTFTISTAGILSVQLLSGVTFTGDCGMTNLHGCYLL